MESGNDELVKSIKELQKKVDGLAGAYEDALADRLFHKTQEQIKKWLGVWIAAMTIALGLLGLKSWWDITGSAQTKTSEYMTNTAQNTIKTQLNDILIPKINDAVNTAIEERKPEINDQINRLVDATAAKTVEARVAAIPVEPSDSKIKPAKTPVLFQGYVVSDYFSNGSGNKVFAQDDTIISTAAVNVRKFDPSKPYMEWQINGTIPKGSKAKVLQAGIKKDSFILLEIDQTQ